MKFCTVTSYNNKLPSHYVQLPNLFVVIYNNKIFSTATDVHSIVIACLHTYVATSESSLNSQVYYI